ncbi:MAG TPA: hypothetical protein VEI97_09870, partial [bacterium]|nr:hypothetical protein [bacterium]
PVKLSPQQQADILSRPGVVVGPLPQIPGEEPAPRKPRRPKGEPTALQRVQLPNVCLVIPGWHPALKNQLHSGHWSVRSKLKSRDRDMVRLAALTAALRPMDYAHAAKRRLDLLLVLPRGKRAPDPDSSWESVLDACTHAGLIHNDSPAWVELAPVQYARSLGGGWWGTCIQLFDL